MKMTRILHVLKNKYVATTTVFVLYGLFLDDVDIFTIVRQNKKLSTLNMAKEEVANNLKVTKETLSRLKHRSEVEKFAREKKLFKKDNEDVFVISYE